MQVSKQRDPEQGACRSADIMMLAGLQDACSLRTKEEGEILPKWEKMYDSRHWTLESRHCCWSLHCHAEMFTYHHEMAVMGIEGQIKGRWTTRVCHAMLATCQSSACHSEWSASAAPGPGRPWEWRRLAQRRRHIHTPGPSLLEPHPAPHWCARTPPCTSHSPWPAISAAQVEAGPGFHFGTSVPRTGPSAWKLRLETVLTQTATLDAVGRAGQNLSPTLQEFFNFTLNLQIKIWFAYTPNFRMQQRSVDLLQRPRSPKSPNISKAPSQNINLNAFRIQNSMLNISRFSTIIKCILRILVLWSDSNVQESSGCTTCPRLRVRFAFESSAREYNFISD